MESTVFHLGEHGDLHPKPVLSESGGLCWWPGIGCCWGPESWIFLPESRCNVTTCSSLVAVNSNAFHICWFWLHCSGVVWIFDAHGWIYVYS